MERKDRVGGGLVGSEFERRAKSARADGFVIFSGRGIRKRMVGGEKGGKTIALSLCVSFRYYEFTIHVLVFDRTF